MENKTQSAVRCSALLGVIGEGGNVNDKHPATPLADKLPHKLGDAQIQVSRRALELLSCPELRESLGKSEIGRRELAAHHQWLSLGRPDPKVVIGGRHPSEWLPDFELFLSSYREKGHACSEAPNRY